MYGMPKIPKFDFQVLNRSASSASSLRVSPKEAIKCRLFLGDNFS
jgi:hypothetical protein